MNAQLSEQEIQKVLKFVAETPNISSCSAGDLLHAQKIIRADIEGQLAGMCMVKKVSKRFDEIALLIVFPEFQGRGLGQQLFDQAFTDIVTRKKSIYCVSRNPIVIEMMKKNNFEFKTHQTLPLEVTLFNIKFFSHPVRIKEYIRKEMYKSEHGPFVHGIKLIQDT